MVAAFPEPDVPFAPGKSPFRIKGIGYRAAVTNVKRLLDERNMTWRDAFSDISLAMFFEQPFLAASLYDVFPVISLINLGAALANEPVESFARDQASTQAEQDLTGVYKLLLMVASPEAVAKRLPRLTAQYFNFGEVEDEGLVAPGKVAMTRRHMPTSIVEWYGIAAGAYVEFVLGRAGGRNAESRVTDIRADETLQGLPTQQMRFEFTWDA